MALTTPATFGFETGQAPGKPTFNIRISFLGDDAYATGGTPAFQAFVRAAVGGRAVEVIDIVSGDCGDNIAYYDKANDKLKVRVMSTAAEVAGSADLSSDTFNVTCICR